MLNRRNALGLLSALSVGLTVRAQAASAAEAASSFVKATGDKLVAVVNGAGSLDARRKELMPIIDSAGGCARRSPLLPGPLLAVRDR